MSHVLLYSYAEHMSIDRLFLVILIHLRTIHHLPAEKYTRYTEKKGKPNNCEDNMLIYKLRHES